MPTTLPLTPAADSLPPAVWLWSLVGLVGLFGGAIAALSAPGTRPALVDVVIRGAGGAFASIMAALGVLYVAAGASVYALLLAAGVASWIGPRLALDWAARLVSQWLGSPQPNPQAGAVAPEEKKP